MNDDHDDDQETILETAIGFILLCAFGASIITLIVMIADRMQ